MDSDRLYLDYNATSPLSQSVLDWLKSGDVLFANPASQHTWGKSSRKTINESRSKIFDVFGKSEKDTHLFFHSGATEAFHTFTYSFSELARKQGKELLVVYSRTDHPAVLSLGQKFWGEHVHFLELSLKSDLSYDHEVNALKLKGKKAASPDLIILYHHLWVHNETGQVSETNQLQMFREIPDLYLHIDAVQAPGKIENWHKLDSQDIWTFSAHKFGALKGVGFTFMSKKMPFSAFISGGGQQQGLRSGTENPQGVKCVALALNDLLLVNVKNTMALKNRLVQFLENELVGLGGVIKTDHQNSNTIYFYLKHHSSDIALAFFDLQGIMLSAGSACSSGAAKDSQVLLELGLVAVARNGLRISLPFEFNEGHLNSLQARLAPIFNKLRDLLPKP